MNWDDIKDQAKEKWQEFQDQLEESSTYHNLREKYLELPHPVQKAIIVGGIVFGGFLLFSIPISYISSSNEFVESYNSRRGLIRNLFQYGQVDSIQAGLPQGKEVSVGAFRSTLDSFQLLPEQVVAVKKIPPDALGDSIAPLPIIQSNFKVELKWLNVQQIVDIGFQLQKLKSHVKMLGLEVKEDREKENYYNVTYKLAGFFLPVVKKKEPEEDKKQSKRTRRRRQRENK